MTIDHSAYMIHLEGLETCLSCPLADCIYDLNRLDPRRQAGCAYENSRDMTGTEVMMRRNHQKRIAAFKKIAKQIEAGKRLNLKEAALLTGMSTAALSKYVQAGYLAVDRFGQRGYAITEVRYFEQAESNQAG